MQLFYKRMGEVLHRIPRCGGGTASMGVGTPAPSIQNGKGNQREENGQKTLKRRARGCANHGSKRMYFVRCGPSYGAVNDDPTICFSLSGLEHGAWWIFFFSHGRNGGSLHRQSATLFHLRLSCPS